MTSWFEVPLKDEMPEIWSGPIRLSTLSTQFQFWNLRSRVVDGDPFSITKTGTPVIGFLQTPQDSSAGMVLILPPSKGEKKWKVLSGSGGEQVFHSLREIQKVFKDQEWVGQSIVLSSISGSGESDEGDKVTGNWFWSAIWKNRADFFPILPASILINLFAIAMPLFIMNVYDRVVPNEALSTLWVLTSGVCVVFGFEFLLRLVRGAFVDAAGKGADRILSRKVFNQLVNIELSSRPPSAGNLAGQARGYESVREFLSSLTLIGLIDFPFALLMFFIVFVVGGVIGWVPFLATGVILICLLLIQPFLAKFSGISHRDRLNRQSLLTETANGLESIKAVNAGSSLEFRMESLVEESADNVLKQRRLTQLGAAFTALCTHLTTIAVIVLGTLQISRGELSMGGLIACVMIVSRGMAPLGQVSQLLLRLQGVRASLSGLQDVMVLKRENEIGKLTPRLECPEIKFVQAEFQYPAQPIAALSGVNLRILPGERVGLIGRAGSGKTTLLRLINRQLICTSGLVLFDGVDASQISPGSIRRTCGYLPQDGTLFVGSVRENIALGSTIYSDSEIIEAATAAGVMSWANRHPLGLDMEVGERGVLLSGGQKQTVMIARLLLRKPRILLLDEPTNSLDLGAENRFRESVAGIMAAGPLHSLVLATHKLSLLKMVDRVVVLEGGQVLLDGPRNEVLAALKKIETKQE